MRLFRIRYSSSLCGLSSGMQNPVLTERTSGQPRGHSYSHGPMKSLTPVSSMSILTSTVGCKSRVRTESPASAQSDVIAGAGARKLHVPVSGGLRRTHCGADDYLTIPFSPKEPVTRLGALIRRSALVAREDLFAVEEVPLSCSNSEITRLEDKVEVAVGKGKPPTFSV
jgi:hypothetical protein